MKLFDGLSRTDYQDLFRAIGAILDDRGWRDIRLWEHQDGLIVQGREEHSTGSAFQTVLLTDDDLEGMLSDAYGRRTKTA